MKKYHLLSLFLLIINCCGECPPCKDEMTEEHWELLECAKFREYVEGHLICITFADHIEVPGKEPPPGKITAGATGCDCLHSVIKRRYDSGYIIKECESMVHEAAHIEEGCTSGEDYAEAVGDMFLESVYNDCWHIIYYYNLDAIE